MRSAWSRYPNHEHCEFMLGAMVATWAKQYTYVYIYICYIRVYVDMMEQS